MPRHGSAGNNIISQPTKRTTLLSGVVLLFRSKCS
jgi:hypothetical protein